jgi:DnaJ-class molecular chaperone
MMGEADISDLFHMMFGGAAGAGGVHVFTTNMGGGGHPMGAMGGGGMPFFDPREFVFRQMQKPPAIIRTVEISMVDAYKGCSVPVDIQIWSMSKGSGEKKMTTENIMVEVQPGTDTNDSFAIQGMGNDAGEGSRGDIKIVFRVLPHDEFERRGLDLVFRRTLTLKESLCGFSFEIKHLNGKLLTFNNEKSRAIVYPGLKKIIPGMGMIRDGTTGNLVVEFDVKFPDSLTSEQIESIKQIL